ncbi:pre-peptidase C-terminal domain-containing protein [Cohnella sp. OV330]|uniref:lipase/acyltransferase domain-containing protein n=1 Tax=Cohnella sp. OV330 TaxID=1855288 RepID=UPI0011607979|nr:pre-peptidase C-terminal domain-containing protein [Cohnella sp. OV330]
MVTKLSALLLALLLAVPPYASGKPISGGTGGGGQDITPPHEAAGFAAAETDDGIRLTWRPPLDGDLDHFNLYIRRTGAADYEMYVPILYPSTASSGGVSSLSGANVDANVGTRSYTAEGLERGRYDFKLTTVDRNGNESAGATASASVGDTAAPGPVTGVQVVAQGSRLAVVWHDPTDADLAGVRVSVRRAGDEDGRTVEVAAGAGAYTTDGLKDGSYEIAIVAYDAAGNASEPVRATASTDPDAHEPNDGTGTAFLLPLPQIQVRGILETEADSDYYALRLQAPSRIRLALRDESRSAAFSYKLSDLGGQRVYRQGTAEANGDTAVEVTLGTGVYYLRIYGGSAAESIPYTILGGTGDYYESNDTIDTATPLRSDAPVPFGTIDRTEDVDWYRLTPVQAGNSMIQLRGLPPGVEYELVLTDDAGTPIARATGSSGREATIVRELGALRTYYVYVRKVSGVSGEPYTLEWSELMPDRLEPNDTMGQAVPIVAPQNFSYRGTIHAAGDEDFYRFKIEQTSSVNLTLADIPGFRNYDMQLWNDRGEIVAASVSPAEAEEKIKLPLNPGTYYVRVYASQGFSGREYTLGFSVRTIPVILVPGLGGTTLYTKKRSNGQLERTWMTQIQNRWATSKLLPSNPDYEVVVDRVDNGLTAIDNLYPEGHIDPVQYRFLGLISDLKKRGYRSGMTLFGFPYDWRMSHADQVAPLKEAVDRALAASGAEQAIVISEGSGGLIVKQLAHDYPAYKAKLNRWIGISTPNLGTPEMFKVYLSGGHYGYRVDPTTFQQLAMQSPGFYELLPSPGWFAYLKKIYEHSRLYTDYREDDTITTVESWDQMTDLLATLYMNPKMKFEQSYAQRALELHKEIWDRPLEGVAHDEIAGSGRPTAFSYYWGDWSPMNHLDQLHSDPLGFLELLFGGNDHEPSELYHTGDSVVPLLSQFGAIGTQEKRYFVKGASFASSLNDFDIRKQIADLMDGREVPVTARISTETPDYEVDCAEYGDYCIAPLKPSFQFPMLKLPTSGPKLPFFP